VTYPLFYDDNGQLLGVAVEYFPSGCACAAWPRDGAGLGTSSLLERSAEDRHEICSEQERK